MRDLIAHARTLYAGLRSDIDGMEAVPKRTACVIVEEWAKVELSRGRQ